MMSARSFPNLTQCVRCQRHNQIVLILSWVPKIEPGDNDSPPKGETIGGPYCVACKPQVTETIVPALTLPPDEPLPRHYCTRCAQATHDGLVWEWSAEVKTGPRWWYENLCPACLPALRAVIAFDDALEQARNLFLVALLGRRGAGLAKLRGTTTHWRHDLMPFPETVAWLVSAAGRGSTLHGADEQEEAEEQDT